MGSPNSSLPAHDREFGNTEDSLMARTDYGKEHSETALGGPQRMDDRAKSSVFSVRCPGALARGGEKAYTGLIGEVTDPRLETSELGYRFMVDTVFPLCSSRIKHWCLRRDTLVSDCENSRTPCVRYGAFAGASPLFDRAESVSAPGETRMVSDRLSLWGEFPLSGIASETAYSGLGSNMVTPRRHTIGCVALFRAAKKTSESVSAVKPEPRPSTTRSTNATSRHTSLGGPSVGKSACHSWTPGIRPLRVVSEKCEQRCKGEETGCGQQESRGRTTVSEEVVLRRSGAVSRQGVDDAQKKQRKTVLRLFCWVRPFLRLASFIFVVSLLAFWSKDGAYALTCDSRGSGLPHVFFSTSSVSLYPCLPHEKRCCQRALPESFSPDFDPSSLRTDLPSLTHPLPFSVSPRYLSGRQAPDHSSSLLSRRLFGAALSATASPTAVPSFSCFLTPLNTERSPCFTLAPKVSPLRETPTHRFTVDVAASSLSAGRGGAQGIQGGFWNGMSSSGKSSTASSSGLQGSSLRRHSNDSDEAPSRTQEEWVEELTAALQSGALKIPALTVEVTKAAGGRQITPRGLDDLIKAAAAVRAGLPLPSHLFQPEEEESGKEDVVDQSLQKTKGSSKAEENKSSNEGKRSVAAYADEARRLQANLDGVNEEKKEFFLNAYRRELRHRGVDDHDCQTPQDLCNRLAFARVFNSSKGSRGASKAAREAGTVKVVRAEVTDGGRGRRSRRSRGRLVARLSSADDDDADGDADDGSSSGIVQISPGVFMARGGSLGGGTGSPFDRLFADVFGGSFFGGRPEGEDDESNEEDGEDGVSPRRGVRGGSLLDHLFGGDLFSSLLGGGLMSGGLREAEDDEGSAKARVKKLDFKTAESAEASRQPGSVDKTQDDDVSSEETDTRLLQLLNKAQARGDPSLAMFLKKSFRDPSLREMLLTAQTEGVEAAEAMADGRGKYVLQRLKDNQLFG
ncbi:hypothetical protein TGP89_201270 [Toxoplasma gondii p89]|uniref:Uncharacterized protein n=2 Tax=Toxoplasma gondii TaxID=5811 RepID=A0A2T6IW66_TOXGO|nr:hypothetical protein TGP89_201270 [Toxoplasma gondii p89]PUA89589.1 hypothetical protein TGBR9_201270 [Toxoplasma gondii TgCATBr9]